MGDPTYYSKFDVGRSMFDVHSLFVFLTSPLFIFPVFSLIIEFLSEAFIFNKLHQKTHFRLEGALLAFSMSV